MATKTKDKVERGTISISTEDIFPIIKRSLYSDQEIFLRELVSNAVDATQKLKVLSNKGEYDGDLAEAEITVSIDKEAGTLTISDRGLGMDAKEIKKYINQVAFSGAEEFLKKFKAEEQREDIIGKFGLGFYSAYMVSKKVEIVSRSYRHKGKATRWTCDGSTEYTIEDAKREHHGTDVILHLDDEAKAEYSEESRIRTLLEKYCRFLPVPIKLGEEQINDTNPLWRKAPSEIEDAEYLEFFKKLYPFAEEPLFWIHLNIDHPFNLTGILYFPKIKKDIDPRKSQIQLYSRQVFITDEVTDIVPEYLMLLKGVIDSPDIPLNVSRSYLQGDPNVRKISSYITKKVADKLKSLHKSDAKGFEEKWDDISVFVKYGMLTDENFYEKAENFCLLKSVDGSFATLKEYAEKIAPKQTNKDEKVVHLYTTNREREDMYIQSAQAAGYDVLEMDGYVDSHFIGLLERKQEKVTWARVDSDIPSKLISKEEKEGEEKGESVLDSDQSDRLKAVFEEARPMESINIQFEDLGKDQQPLVITRNEFMRRMKEQSAMGGGMMMMGDMPETMEASVNTSHPIIQKLAEQKEPDAAQARQLLDLALLSQNMLTGSALTDFIKRSVELM